MCITCIMPYARFSRGQSHIMLCALNVSIISAKILENYVHYPSTALSLTDALPF